MPSENDNKKEEFGSVFKRLSKLVAREETKAKKKKKQKAAIPAAPEGGQGMDVAKMHELVKSTAERVKDKGNLASLKRDFSNVIDRIQDTEKELDTIKSKVSSLDEKRRVLKRELDSLQQQKIRADEDNTPKRVEHAQLKKKAEDLRIEDLKVSATLNTLEDEIKKAKKELSNLEKQKRHEENLLEELVNSAANLPKEIKSLGARIAANRDAIEAKKKAVSQSGGRRRVLESRLNSSLIDEQRINAVLRSVLSEIDAISSQYSLYSDVKEAEENVRKAEFELTRLLKDISNRKQAREGLVKSRFTLNSEISFLDDRVNYLKKSLAEIDDEEDRVKDRYSEYAYTDELSGKIQKEKEKTEKLKKDLEAKKQDAERIMAEIEQTNKDFEPVREKYQELTEQVDMVLEEKKALEEELRSMGGEEDLKIPMPPALKSALKKEELKLKELEKKLESLTEEQNGIYLDQDNIEAAIKEQEELIQGLIDKQKKAEQEIRTEEDPFGERKKAIQEELSRLESQKNDLTQELERFLKEKASSKRRLNSLNKKIENEREIIKDLEAKLPIQKNKIEGLKKSLVLVRNKKKMAWSGDDALRRLISPVKEVFDHVTDVKGKIEARMQLLNDEKATLETKLAEANEKTRKIKREITDLEEEDTTNSLEIQELIEEIEDFNTKREVYEGKLHDIRLRIPFVESKIKDLGEKTEEIREKSEKKTDLIQEILDRRGKIKEKEDALNRQMDDVLGQIENNTTLVTKIQVEYDEKHQKFEEASTDLIKSLDMQKQLQSRLQQLHEKAVMLENEISIVENIYINPE